MTKTPAPQYKQKPPGCQAATGPRRRLSPVKIGAGVLLAGAGLALGSLVYAWTATHPRRKRLWQHPSDFGLPCEKVHFRAADGLRLSGWLIPAPAENDREAVIVVCHGYPYNRCEMLPHARFLHEAGFTVLLFDFRAMGESEGDLSTIGHEEVQDLLGALDYLTRRQDTAHLPVGALGHSLGGAVAIMAAARDERVRAVVAEASYPTLQHALDARCRAFLGPLGPVVAHSTRYWASRWFPVKPGEVAPIAEIRQIGPRAVMIIQGQRDLQVRWKDAVEMYAAAQEPRELWLLRKSGHARCLRDAPDEYARRVTAFFTAHLRGS
ncbi:MAG TPA: alpha/beta hydrolase [Chthonomonadaceae bacterium]|nr:alpha/beta hydrolase [Chthonomonadaceae bacterium]